MGPIFILARGLLTYFNNNKITKNVLKSLLEDITLYLVEKGGFFVWANTLERMASEAKLM